MKALEQVVADSFAKLIAAGTIEAAIEKKLAECVTSAIDDGMRSYGEFGKQIKEHVSKALQVNFENLTLPSYNDFILKIIRKNIEANMNSAVTAKMAQDLAEMMTPAAPESVTLEKLIAQFIKYETEEDGSNAGDKISFHLEESQHGFRYVYFDKDSNREKHRCDYRIGVDDKDGRIFTMTIDRKDISKTLFVGQLYDFERTLFQMYTAGTKLIIEQDAHADDFDLHFPERD